ncbi:Signal transduction histidine kinase [hydrothermal vent metagenome]|uniref:Signal transduction histidine kinase n=1 Tax=hydrothermal vent metagenome TaxID=652676 RepID=A0A3B0Y866_9ZZZZ
MTSGKTSNLFELILASSIHDIKNSISLLLNKVDSLTTGLQVGCPLNSEQQLIQQQGTEIQQNLIRLLAIYRIQNKQYFLNVEEHYLNDYLNEILEPQIAACLANNIIVKLFCDNNLYAYFDRELITGLMYNIIGNASRYAHSKIDIQVNVNKNKQLFITISDDGPGYPSQLLDTTLSENSIISFDSGNTGLGLTFCSMIAEMHTNKNSHGYIQLSNQGIRQGACFTLFLP